MGKYDGTSEYRTDIAGWICLKCKRYWGDDKNMSEYCCAKTATCETCGGTRDKYSWCRPCREAAQAKKWNEMRSDEWDGDYPLCLHDDDKFFFSWDDLADYVAFENVRPDDMRLVMCDPDNGPTVTLEIFCDCLPEDVDEPSGADTIQHKMDELNAVIKANAPYCWWPSNRKPSGPKFDQLMADLRAVYRESQRGD